MRLGASAQSRVCNAMSASLAASCAAATHSHAIAAVECGVSQEKDDVSAVSLELASLQGKSARMSAESCRVVCQPCGVMQSRSSM